MKKIRGKLTVLLAIFMISGVLGIIGLMPGFANEKELNTYYTFGDSVSVDETNGYKVTFDTKNSWAAFVLNDALKTDCLIEFDMSIKYDASGAEDSNYQNRKMQFVFNQADEDGTIDPDKFILNWGPAGATKGAHGFQWYVTRPQSWEVSHGVQGEWFATGSVGSIAPYTDPNINLINSNLAWPMSDQRFIHVTVSKDTQHYTISLNAYDEFPDPMTLQPEPFEMKIPVNRICDTDGDGIGDSDFTAAPYFGIRVDNGIDVATENMYVDIQNFKNGTVREIYAEDISLDEGDEVVEPQVSATFYGESRSVVYTYSCEENGVVYVEDNVIKVKKDCPGGVAKIKVTSDEGDITFFSVSYPDTIAPEIEVKAVPENGTTYSEICLPYPSVLTDNSGDVAVKVICGEKELPLISADNQKYFRFIVKEPGSYTVVYNAFDAMGNFTEIEKVINITENMSAEKNWFVGNSENVNYDLLLDEDYALFDGEIGTNTTTMDTSESIFIVNKNAYVVNEAYGVEFDLRVVLSAGENVADVNNSDNTRFFSLFIGDAVNAETGEPDATNLFVMQNGVRLRIGRAQHWESAKFGVYTGLHNDDSNIYSAGHFNTGNFPEEAVINGTAVYEKNFYNYQTGQAENVVNTLYKGETVHVALRLVSEEDESFYVLTVAGVSWKIPEIELNGTKNFYIAAAFTSMDGNVKNTFEISNIRNGTIRSVMLQDEDGNTEKTIESSASAPILKTSVEEYDGVDYTLSYSSTDDSIATVDENGVISLKGGLGCTVIRVESGCGKYAEYRLYVKEKAAVPQIEYAVTDCSITITPLQGALYRLDEGDWTDSNVFLNLLPGSVHTVSVQYQETETLFASDVATIQITLTKSIVSIEADVSNAKTEYYVGDEFDPSGIKVTVKYNDDSQEQIDISEAVFSGFDSVETGEKIVTISYREKQTTFKVIVNESAQEEGSGCKTSIESNFLLMAVVCVILSVVFFKKEVIRSRR